MTLTTLASTAALVLSAFSTAAATAQPFETIEATLTLDAGLLETSADAAYADLVDQAEAACTVTYGLNALGSDIDRACVAEILDSAVAAVGSEALLRVHARAAAPAQFASRD